jgi:hypothetical protein
MPKKKPSLARKLVGIMLELAEGQKKQRAQSFTGAEWAAHHLRMASDAMLAIRSDYRSQHSNNEWLKRAKEASFLFVCFLMSIDDQQHPWRLVQEALEKLPSKKIHELSKGKQHKGKFDFPIIRAYAQAMRTGKRKAERGPNGDPFFSEVYEALCKNGESDWRRDHVPWKRPNRDYVLRRCKELGLALSQGNPGRPQKAKAF